MKLPFVSREMHEAVCYQYEGRIKLLEAVWQRVQQERTPPNGAHVVNTPLGQELRTTNPPALPPEVEDAIKRNAYGNNRIVALNRTFARQALQRVPPMSVEDIVAKIDSGKEAD